MKQASIVSVGNEILSGHTVDTNAAEISRELLVVDVPVVSVYAVADERSAIVRALRLACADADVVVVTGGLGPTDDDVTRQAFADFLETKLIVQQPLLEDLERFFHRRGVPMPARNRIQACLPQGAEAIRNEGGTAPGIRACKHGRWLFALPGVPAEMRQMLRDTVIPALRGLARGQAVVVRKLRCFGAGESSIAERLGEMMARGRNPLVNSTVSAGVTTLHIVAHAADRLQAEQMVQADEQSIRDALGDLVFGTDDQTLAEVVAEELVRRGKTIAIAESCTGGLLAKLLTDVPGASTYFVQSWVTYSDRAKCDELGVEPEFIKRCGAVSAEVAQAMAAGARRRSGADYTIGITGIAGPAGGTEQKPVGLVYISVDTVGEILTERCVFSGQRCTIRLRAAQTALNMVRLRVRN